MKDISLIGDPILLIFSIEHLLRLCNLEPHKERNRKRESMLLYLSIPLFPFPCAKDL